MIKLLCKIFDDIDEHTHRLLWPFGDCRFGIHPGQNGFTRLALCRKPIKQTEKPRSLTENRDGISICMDVSLFKPDELCAKVLENSVIVEGTHAEREDEHGYVSRQFVRRFVLPENYNASELDSTLSLDGILTLYVPKPILSERMVEIKQEGCIESAKEKESIENHSTESKQSEQEEKFSTEENNEILSPDNTLEKAPHTCSPEEEDSPQHNKNQHPTLCEENSKIFKSCSFLNYIVEGAKKSNSAKTTNCRSVQTEKLTEYQTANIGYCVQSSETDQLHSAFQRNNSRKISHRNRNNLRKELIQPATKWYNIRSSNSDETSEVRSRNWCPSVVVAEKQIHRNRDDAYEARLKTKKGIRPYRMTKLIASKYLEDPSSTTSGIECSTKKRNLLETTDSEKRDVCQFLSPKNKKNSFEPNHPSKLCTAKGYTLAVDQERSTSSAASYLHYPKFRDDSSKIEETEENIETSSQHNIDTSGNDENYLQICEDTDESPSCSKKRSVDSSSQCESSSNNMVLICPLCNCPQRKDSLNCSQPEIKDPSKNNPFEEEELDKTYMPKREHKKRKKSQLSNAEIPYYK